MRIIIIGAGVIGTAIARELSRYETDVVLLEKTADVANGTSKANSGIIHAGYNADFNTLKGKLNVKSNPVFDKLCADLKVPFKRIGSFVVGFNEQDLKELKKKKENGEKNGLNNLEIIGRKQLISQEPNINKNAKYALYAPEAAIISPYELTIAYADNAVINGAQVVLNTEVYDLFFEDGKISGVKTNQGEIKADLVINAAGLYSDKIAGMANDEFKINPRKGEYHLFDKEYGDIVNHILFPMPAKNSKGILVLPTVHGNILIGPNAYDTNDKDELSTTNKGLDEILKGARRLIPEIPEKGIITSFSGLRAALDSGDFHIDFSKNKGGLINIIGIQSPGLSSTPAISEMVVQMVKDYSNSEKYNLKLKKDFKQENPKLPHYYEYEEKEKVDEWQKIVKENEDYGEIICRCEHVSRGEIIDAINSPVPAQTIDGIKRRTRASSGRCQAGFCGPRLLKILSDQLDIDPLQVSKKGSGSQILKARSKQLILEKTKQDKKAGDQ